MRGAIPRSRVALTSALCHASAIACAPAAEGCTPSTSILQLTADVMLTKATRACAQPSIFFVQSACSRAPDRGRRTEPAVRVQPVGRCARGEVHTKVALHRLAMLQADGIFPRKSTVRYRRSQQQEHTRVGSAHAPHDATDAAGDDDDGAILLDDVLREVVGTQMQHDDLWRARYPLTGMEPL